MVLPEICERLKGGPEQQRVVGPIVEYLVKEKGYRMEQIFFGKNEWRVPKNPSEATRREKGISYEGYPVDIAVFSSEERTGDPAYLRIIIETKAPDENAGISQLQIYLGLEPSVPLGIWANSPDPSAVAYFLYRGKRTPRRRRISDIPPAGFPIIPDRDPLRFLDLAIPSHETLRKLFEEILDGLASRDPYAVRPEERLGELCNLILLKLESDRKARGQKREDVVVDWQLHETKEATAKWAREAFARFTELYPDLFDTEEQKRIRLSDDSICMVVEALERYRLLEAGSEAVAQAFQILRTEALRSADGQFFTPTPVIRAGTALVGVNWEDLVLDPACGTGGFLMEVLFQIRAEYPEEAHRWAQIHIYGVDRDAVGVKLAKAVMQIAGDGSAHIFRGDSLRSHEWDQHFPRLKEELREGRFSVVLTNPPFGQSLRVSPADLQASGYTIHMAGRKKKDRSAQGDSVEIGLVFLEQSYRLLRPGGKLGIVLPETYFFSPSYRWLFDWLRQRFRPVVVANVPMEAFQQYARAKTNFYVFQKLGEGESTEEGWVTFLNPRTCGISPSGGVLCKETPEGKIVDDELWEHVRTYLLKNELPPGGVRVSLKEAWTRKVLVPNYYDPRYEREFETLLEAGGLKAISLEELIEKDLLDYRFGHGSPERTGREGEVPYIKVSDLRALRVNVNPTNMVPKDLAKRFWRGEKSGLQAWDLLTPIRASSNIGEFSILLPGEEERLLTKEILVIRSLDPETLSPFYFLWAFSLQAVRSQWRRIALMQTNREDVGDRWKEVRIPDPTLDPKWAREVAKPLREYFEGLVEAGKKLASLLDQGFSFIPSLGKLVCGKADVE